MDGLGTREREVLAALRRGTKGVLNVRDAANVLRLPSVETARVLSVLASKGWLKRVKRGTYLFVPMEASSPDVFPEEPWVLASQIFHPCYIGGWSAAEHWDLTEQIFRSTLVVTSKMVRKINVNFSGAEYRIKHCREHKFFGFTPVWRGAMQVNVSELEKTVVDMLDDPSLAGGMRHGVEILKAYWNREDKNFKTLLDYAARMENGAILKRLGYLAENVMKAEKTFLDACREKLSEGNAMLDPNVKEKGKLVSHWRLWVNVKWTNEKE